MQRVLVKDTITGQMVVSGVDLSSLGTGAVVGSGVAEYYEFIVPTGGQTDFPVSQNIEAPIKLLVRVNGGEVREGSDNDYLRDADAGLVIFNYVVPKDSWVEIEVSDPIVSYANFDFDVAAPQSQFSIGTLVKTSSDIRTTINGATVREGIGQDFQRNTPANRVDFNYNIPAGAQVRVAIK